MWRHALQCLSPKLTAKAHEKKRWLEDEIAFWGKKAYYFQLLLLLVSGYMVNIYEYPICSPTLSTNPYSMNRKFGDFNPTFCTPAKCQTKKNRLFNPQKDTKSDKKHLHQNYPLGVKRFMVADGKC